MPNASAILCISPRAAHIKRLLDRINNQQIAGTPKIYRKLIHFNYIDNLPNEMFCSRTHINIEWRRTLRNVSFQMNSGGGNSVLFVILFIYYVNSTLIQSFQSLMFLSILRAQLIDFRCKNNNINGLFIVLSLSFLCSHSLGNYFRPR